MKQIKLFGKTVSASILAMLLMAGIGSAALLTYYGTITATVNAQQSILLDGKSWTNSQVTDTISEAAPGGEKFCNIHTLKNQMSVAGTVEATVTCSGVDAQQGYLNCDGITQTYGTTITDTTSNPIVSFGDKHNEVCGQLTLPSETTLDQIFAGNGLIYNYTVDVGGTYSGASPIVAILNLADGRHVILWPGWTNVGRTDAQSLAFGDTVSYSTANDGNKPVDFTVYSSTWGNLFSSTPTYPAWTAVKALSGVPVTGNEYVTSIEFQHQSANTGETDTLNGFAFDSRSLKFSSSPFNIPSDQEIAFCLCNNFVQNIYPGTYTITTNLVPA